MHAYARRILLSAPGRWWPAIATVAVVTALVGLCATQFVWTHDDRFIAAARSEGHALTEFTIAAETIYALVAALALFSLTVVGTATVEQVRRTFARWRLVGATPSDVRRSMWVLAATVACAGAVPGSLISIAVGPIVVPAFNQMAAPGFDAPVLPPSPLAWAVSLLLGIATCMLGAFGPARRASKAQAIEVFRALPVRRRKVRWWRALPAAAALLSSLGMLTAAVATGASDAGAVVMFKLALYAGLSAVLFVYLAGPLLTPAILSGLGGLGRALGSVTGWLAAKAAVERANTSANTVAPLAAGIGGVGVVLVSVESTAAVVRTFDTGADTNLTDTLVMAALISVVLLVTSAAVAALASGGAERELSLLRIAGMPRLRVTAWYAWQSFASALTAAVLALVPIGIAAAATAVSSTAYTGRPITVVPWTVPVLGFVLSGLVLFLVQWPPARRFLRADIAVGLRAA